MRLPDPRPLDPSAIRAIMAGILLAMFLSALEQTIVGPALPTIGRSLQNVESLSWVVTAYLLACTAVTPLFGKLSDIYGRRVIMLISIAIFQVGSVACALAPNMYLLIAARTLQGIGGGGILPLAHTIIGDMVPPRERARYQAYTAMMFMAASITGPVLGGALTEYVHWTFVFWINLPIGLVAMVIASRALRNLPRNERPHSLDFLGATLLVGAALSLMLAITWGGTQYPWMSWRIMSLLAVSLVLWFAFAVRLRAAPEPFIPLAVLCDSVVASISVLGFFSVGVVIGLSIYLPVYLETVLGFSPSGSGAAMIVFLAAATIGSYIAGHLLMWMAHYKRISMVGLILGIAVLAIFAAKPSGLILWEVTGLLAVGGTGLGMMYPITTVIIQNAVAPHQLGTATGTLNFSRLLGGAITVAAFGAILIGGVGGQGLTLDMLTAGGLARAHASLADQFRWVFAAGAMFLIAGLVALFVIEERPLRGPSQF